MTPSLNDCLHIAPEILLAVWGLVVLIADITILRTAPSDERRNILGILTIVGCFFALLRSRLSFNSIPMAISIP